MPRALPLTSLQCQVPAMLEQLAPTTGAQPSGEQLPPCCMISRNELFSHWQSTPPGTSPLPTWRLESKTRHRLQCALICHCIASSAGTAVPPRHGLHASGGRRPQPRPPELRTQNLNAMLPLQSPSVGQESWYTCACVCSFSNQPCTGQRHSLVVRSHWCTRVLSDSATRGRQHVSCHARPIPRWLARNAAGRPHLRLVALWLLDADQPGGHGGRSLPVLLIGSFMNPTLLTWYHLFSSTSA